MTRCVHKMRCLWPLTILVAAFIFLYITGSAAYAEAHYASTTLKSADDLDEALIMIMIGCLCAIGSALSCYIPFPDNQIAGSSALIGRVATGFLLGAFGGVAFLEYAGTKSNFGLSTVGLIGVITLFISLLGVPVIQTIYRIGKKWLDSKDIEP